MKQSCVYRPSKNTEFFDRARKDFSYNMAWTLYHTASSPKFREDFKNKLKFDSNGMPTYESFIKLDYIKAFISEEVLSIKMSAKYKSVEDTKENYEKLLEEAYKFNMSPDTDNDFIAYIVKNEDNTIRIKINKRDERTVEIFNNQYGQYSLGNRLAQIFKPLGITVGHLEEVLTKSGLSGRADFSVLRDLANNLSNVVRVSNNMEGSEHVSEELSHLIINVFRSTPLIQRAISNLEQNEEYMKQILGEKDYNDQLEFHEGDKKLLAEETLAHILQNNLLAKQEKVITPAKSMYKRMYDNIKDKFKNTDVDAVPKAIADTENIMSKLASDILNGSVSITQEQLESSASNVRMNALSDRIERNIKILKEAAKTEAKRYKISKGAKTKTTALVDVSEILSKAKEDSDTVLGLLNYAKSALENLQSLEYQFKFIDDLPLNKKFTFLRLVSSYIDSYGKFIHDMNNAINEESDEENNMFETEYEIDGMTVSVQEIMKDLGSLSDRLARRFSSKAIPAFAEFLKPFLGDEIVVPFGKYAGTKMSVQDLLTKESDDITFMDRWLQAMGDSSDPILAGANSVVQEVKTNQRLKFIEFAKKVNIWREKAERAGIKDFEWAFERTSDGRKTHNYISPINFGQFAKDYNELMDSLDEKYGKNPVGENLKNKIAERKQWLLTHAMSIYGTPKPDPELYRNKAYDNLTETQKNILQEFLHLKNEMDSLYPEEKRKGLNFAIQIRKGRTERFFQSTTSPSTMFENIKEGFKSAFLESEDDYEFGYKTSLRNFDGTEYMTLPMMYMSELKNPEELSNDLAGSLLTYGYAALQYDGLEDVVDALEVGRDIIKARKVNISRGGAAVKERISSLGITQINNVNKTASQMLAKYEDFLESQVYHKYLKDEGTFGDSKVSKTKATSMLLKLSSLAQMGFNFLANIANVNTGLAMQNIEAVAGQFFNAKELAKADWEYKNHILQCVRDANSRSNKDKLSLFMELFDIKQDSEQKSKRLQTKNLLQRIFGNGVAFLGQSMGDHWLYGRTAIAMAMREKVLLDGKEMSLWDALKVRDVQGSSGLKELDYYRIKSLDGNKFDINNFQRKVAKVNQYCFGIYNEEDMNMASRVSMGRLMQQYRKWMTVQYSRRFRSGFSNITTGTYDEGYYRTLGRYLKELKDGGFRLAEVYNNLTKEEQYNIKRALTELVQVAALFALVNIIQWPDDKDRPWAIKLAEYNAKRLLHEVGGLAPTPIMIQEAIKTVQSPIPATSVVKDMYNAIKYTVSPSGYEELQSGPYKGMTKMQKGWLRAPIPGIRAYRQIDKFMGVDYMTRFYEKD